jgi:hypothetical protein
MRSVWKPRTLLKAGVLGAGAALLAMPTAAQAPGLAMLGTLAKGAWNLRIRDDASEQRICVRDGQEFIQLRHKQQGCSRFVVQDDPSEVVVQYTCRGNGYGRTSIRRESAELVQVQSRGIIDGAPFAISGEARHAGSC